MGIPLFFRAGAAALVVVAAAASGSAAPRVEKPYCASNKGNEFTETICEFATLEECSRERIGMGGWCHLNPYYVAPNARSDSAGRSDRRVRPQR